MGYHAIATLIKLAEQVAPDGVVFVGAELFFRGFDELNNVIINLGQEGPYCDQNYDIWPHYLVRRVPIILL